MSLMLGREQNFESMLDGFEFWLKTTDFVYKHDSYDRTHKFVIVADIGKNWSFYLGETMKLIFEQIDIKTEYEISSKVLILTITENKK